jgi:hypothetical protein
VQQEQLAQDLPVLPVLREIPELLDQPELLMVLPEQLAPQARLALRVQLEDLPAIQVLPGQPVPPEILGQQALKVYKAFKELLALLDQPEQLETQVLQVKLAQQDPREQPEIPDLQVQLDLRGQQEQREILELPALRVIRVPQVTQAQPDQLVLQE